MKKHFGSLKGKTIAVWGLAFKPKTDDMREAPAIPLIEALLAAGATVQAYDPEAMGVAKRHLRQQASPTPTPTTTRSRAPTRLAIVTEWNEFRRPDFDADALADADAGHLRRPQPVHAGADEAERVHLLLHWPPLTRASVLVTGGAGYIGSHAAKALRAAGYRVDRSTTTCRPGTARRRSARR